MRIPSLSHTLFAPHFLVASPIGSYAVSSSALGGSFVVSLNSTTALSRG